LMETRSNLLRQAIERMQYADQIRKFINGVKDKAIGQGGPKELDTWTPGQLGQLNKLMQ